jgi:hypothetical protein
MGPYPTREAAAQALESARSRTIAWEASDGDSRARTPWREPVPVPLSGFERWVLTHRGAFQALMFSTAGALLVLQIVALVQGDGLIATAGVMVLFVYWGVRGVRMVEQRAREVEERGGAARRP